MAKKKTEEDILDEGHSEFLLKKVLCQQCS